MVSLFGALSVHTMSIYRGSPVQQRLAENKSHQCILALSELAKTWPVGMWIVKSFLGLMKRLTSRATASGGSRLSVTSRIGTDGNPPVSTELRSTRNLAAREACNTQTCPSSGVESMADSSSDNAGGIDPLQPQSLPGFPSGAADQLVYDSLWLDCPDNRFDIDFLEREMNVVSSILPSMEDNGWSSSRGF